MRQFALALLIAAMLGACRDRSEAPVVPPGCTGICGTVTDAASGKPVTTFSVGIFRRPEPASVRHMIAMPKGFPSLPGEMVEETTVHSPQGSFRVDDYGGERLVLVVRAPGYRIHQTP